jgi:predicted ribosomally synthesized peptide with SipW-like signal peptide
VVAALVSGGIGGTLATWSDSETSMNNVIATGSVDLKVNGEDDLPWGNGVPQKVQIECMTPCHWYGPFEVECWNAGQCEYPSSLYIHFKNACCSNELPKEDPDGNTTGYPDPETGDLKPEPELAAEYGGKVDCVEVPGIGVTGDNCSMLSHLEVIIGLPDGTCLVGPVALGDILCNEIYITDLMPCQPVTLYLWFHLTQDSEEDWDLDLINPDPWDADLTDAQMLYWEKFNDWPSNATMKDKVIFDIEFDLVLWCPEGPDPCDPATWDNYDNATAG